MVAASSDGRSGQAGASTSVIGAPLVSSSLSSCALTPAGEVRCWGYNGNGAVGTADGVLVQATPVAVSGLTGLVALAGGGKHLCGPTSTLDILCWGNNAKGQLGDPSTLTRVSNPTPAPVAGLRDVVQVVGGSEHTCALKADGAVVCWGDNQTGQLGDGNRSGTPRSSPGPVLTAAGNALTGVLALRSGSDHSCAVLDDGRASVVCWGDNGTLQTSSGAPDHVPATPVQGLGGVLALALTDYSTCAWGFDGSFSCWGDNFFAESSGNGVGGDLVQTPAPFPALQGAQQPVHASGGNTFLCALMQDGSGRCAGRGNDGELGQGIAATARTLQPVATQGGTFWH